MAEVEEATDLTNEDWGVEQTVQAPLEYVKDAVSYAAYDLGYNLTEWDEQSSHFDQKENENCKDTILAFINGNFGVKGAIEVEYKGVPGTGLPKCASKITYSQNLVHSLVHGDQEPHEFFGKVRNYLENNSQEIREVEEDLADELGVGPEEAVEWVANGGRC